MSDEEVDELLKGVQIGALVSSIPTRSFIHLTDVSWFIIGMGTSITSHSCVRFLASRCSCGGIFLPCLASNIVPINAPYLYPLMKHISNACHD